MMKAAVLLLLLLVSTPRITKATEIDGKWGLGIAVGSLFSSGAEAALIRGRSARTAWIADLTANVTKDDRNYLATYDPPYPDTTIVGNVTFESILIEAGPRLRRFTRPESSFSPYWDVFAHFVDSVLRQTYVDRTSSEIQVGGRIGLSIGAEYFSDRWPFSVGAHTDVASFSAKYVSRKGSTPYGSEDSSGSILSGMLALRPILQVRVYF